MYIKIIAHRGLTNGPDEDLENKPEQIDTAISLGFDCEVDVWVETRRDEDLNGEFGYFWLGHDSPQYKVPVTWINERKDKLWIHCKNMKALEYCRFEDDWNFFFHDVDLWTLTSKKHIWAYPSAAMQPGAVLALPEKTHLPDYLLMEMCKRGEIVGLCTDYPFQYMQMIRMTPGL